MKENPFAHLSLHDRRELHRQRRRVRNSYCTCNAQYNIAHTLCVNLFTITMQCREKLMPIPTCLFVCLMVWVDSHSHGVDSVWLHANWGACDWRRPLLMLGPADHNVCHADQSVQSELSWMASPHLADFPKGWGEFDSDFKAEWTI